MPRKQNKDLVPFAQDLRINMTKEERHLSYDFLRRYPVRFYRQKVLGEYIADFYCAAAKLVVELDGSGHYSDEGRAHDAERTAFLQQYGLTVLRVPNNQVFTNFRGVCDTIDHAVQNAIENKKDETKAHHSSKQANDTL